jgi:hypothetical protein
MKVHQDVHYFLSFYFGFCFVLQTIEEPIISKNPISNVNESQSSLKGTRSTSRLRGHW